MRSVRGLLAWAAAALTLAACGGGGVGGEQNPDPVVVDVPIAYVKRPLPVDAQGALQGSDLRELRTFNIGADLFVRDRAAVAAAERNVTDRITQASGLYDIRDPEVSWDGARLVFAMRGPFVQGADEEDQPTWNIWEYTFTGDTLRRVISFDLSAEAGHDLAPAYLPDGRIVFSSTRQRTSKAVLVDEGKQQFEAQDEDRNEPAFVLHVMNADGSDIHQVSFNQSHDLDPSILSNGQILFSRWDNAAANSEMNLYRMNPDGTGLELYYGARSHDTGTDGATVQFSQPREMPDGRILTVVRPFQADDNGGDLVSIDAENFVENLQPTAVNAGVLSGPAQVRTVVNEVRTDDG
ncbi:MAG: PD40 domain-containing protein, partial [Gammaproteobacteria bacterium]|nr:PD40 domain-containing protein [Gammaproteobacteria bacterium]